MAIKNSLRKCLVLGLALWLALAYAQVQPLEIPELEAMTLNGPLEVVATTSIIGDVVAQVGGEAISLTTLMSPGQDPHSYEPAARDLAQVSEAQLVFVNGWGLEESLLGTLKSVVEDAPFVPVSANIVPLTLDEAEAHHEEAHHESEAGADPHTWLEVANVAQWVRNIELVLSTLDPENAGVYTDNARAYLNELDALEAYARSSFDAISQDERKLVTNHDALGYLADAYGFEVVGSVIPGLSTLAEPSARDLAELIRVMEEQGVCTLFGEVSARVSLARTVAAELEHCDSVQVLSLYTGALGPAGSGAESYTGMMRANIDTIVQGLK